MFPLPGPLIEPLAIRLGYQKTIAKSLVIPPAGEGDKDSLHEFYFKVQTGEI
jgi:hypothetical protein